MCDNVPAADPDVAQRCFSTYIRFISVRRVAPPSRLLTLTKTFSATRISLANPTEDGHIMSDPQSETQKKAVLRDLFGGDLDVPEVLDECLAMCRAFNKSPDDLFYAAEAVKYNSKALRFDMDQARRLRDALKKEINDNNNRLTLATPARRGRAPKAVASASAKSAFAQRMMAGVKVEVTTPQSSLKNPSLNRVGGVGSPATGSPVGKIASSLPPVLASSSTSTAGQNPKFRIIPQANAADFSYRYMFEKLHERAGALDSRIDEFGQYVREFYEIADDLGDPNADTEEDVVVVGRIVDSTDTKLTEASVLLEPSRWMGSGRRIPVRFASELRVFPHPNRSAVSPAPLGIGMFPGAIVAFKGAKAYGHEGGFFMAKEILPLPQIKRVPQRPSKGLDLSFSVIVASGPYTFDNDLEYTPFLSLMSEVERHQPSSLILLGPFIDSNHPMIKEGDMDVSFPRLFIDKIAKPLQDLTKILPEMTVGLMPSVRDLASHRNVYPQGAFIGPQAFQGWNRVMIMPNPCAFSISGVSFGVTTVDVLFHLRKSEVFKPVAAAGANANTDPMAGLCRHLLEQRSFYPLFPVPKDVSADVNLDVSHSHLLCLDNEHVPDIMVLPSRLKEFTKVVDGIVFVNPSSTSKFNAGGMVAKITVDAMRQGPERLAVDTIKL